MGETVGFLGGRWGVRGASSLETLLIYYSLLTRTWTHAMSVKIKYILCGKREWKNANGNGKARNDVVRTKQIENIEWDYEYGN